MLVVFIITSLTRDTVLKSFKIKHERLCC